ncbi:MAG: hypothetical protein ACOH1V_13410 [Stenotrophomonas sp.]
MKALRAAKDVARGADLAAWQPSARCGDLVVNGGDSNSHLINQNRNQSVAAKLGWNGGTPVSHEGGGDTVLQRTSGIDLLGSSIHSAAAINGVAMPIR